MESLWSHQYFHLWLSLFPPRGFHKTSLAPVGAACFLAAATLLIQALLSLAFWARATAPASQGTLVTFLITVPTTDKRQGEKRKICYSLWLEDIIHHGGERTVVEMLHGCGCRNRKLLVHM